MMSEPLIQTAGLRKIYGTKVAVDDLTLEVPRGEVFGFLGPNGAGKSTSVKMLLGLVAPSDGTALVLGQPPGAISTMGRIGFLPEHFRFHEWLQAAELLDLHGRLYGMSPAARKQRIPELLALMGLQDHAHRPISGFSKGMLQRIGLAQALLNKPTLVFLDEPTSALDPFGRMLVREIIHDLKARGTTVFLNSHLLGEVEATCDRVAFIKDGRVLQTLALRDYQEGHIRVEIHVDELTPALLDQLRRIAQSVSIANPVGIKSSNIGGGQVDVATGGIAVAATPATLELMIDDEERIPELAERIMASGARLYGLIPHKVSLEQLFLEIVGREDSGQ
jgi:ABC-2 type transport system ATP-binding protein